MNDDPNKKASDAVKAERDKYLPYYLAVRDAHNGYDPEARKDMPGLKEPATPKQAIDDLLEEVAAVRAIEVRQLLDKNKALRKAVARLLRYAEENGGPADMRFFAREALDR